MQERHTDISADDGAMNAFAARPEGAGPLPAVLFCMDAPGQREELHDMARRLARGGHFVVLPNPHCRSPRGVQLGERTPQAMANADLHRGTLNAETTRGDTRVMAQLRCKSHHAGAEIDRWAPPAAEHHRDRLFDLFHRKLS